MEQAVGESPTVSQSILLRVLSDAHSESPAQPDVAEITLAAIDDPSLSGDDQNDIDRYMHSFQFSEHQNTVSGLGAGCCSDLRTPRKDGGTTGIVIATIRRFRTVAFIATVQAMAIRRCVRSTTHCLAIRSSRNNSNTATL